MEVEEAGDRSQGKDCAEIECVRNKQQNLTVGCS